MRSRSSRKSLKQFVAVVDDGLAKKSESFLDGLFVVRTAQPSPLAMFRNIVCSWTSRGDQPFRFSLPWEAKVLRGLASFAR